MIMVVEVENPFQKTKKASIKTTFLDIIMMECQCATGKTSRSGTLFFILRMYRAAFMWIFSISFNRLGAQFPLQYHIVRMVNNG